jgi:hypothetical protein
MRWPIGSGRVRHLVRAIDRLRPPMESCRSSGTPFTRSLDLDTGSTTFTSGPTPVFSGRIVGGQRVDRFRGTTTLTSRRGTLVLRLQQDFVSAGNSYQIATGTWSVVGGTGQYVGLVGGGRSALVRPPSGKYGFASHEGFVSKR